MTRRYFITVRDRTGRWRRVYPQPSGSVGFRRRGIGSFVDRQVPFVRAWARARRYGIHVVLLNPYPLLVLDDDTAMPNADLAAALQRVARRLGRQLFVREGLRTHERQQALWDAYVARNYAPPIVARPGTSRHETGDAADVGVVQAGDADGVSLADFPGGRAASAAEGVGFPVGGEPWHAELVS